MATKRIINPNELMSEIDKVYYDHYAMSHDQTIHDFYNAVCRRIRRCTSVDAVEVVHGRWESTRFGDIRIATCSACGAKQGLYINGRVPNLNYCPNCGAKMDDMSCVP